MFARTREFAARFVVSFCFKYNRLGNAVKIFFFHGAFCPHNYEHQRTRRE